MKKIIITESPITGVQVSGEGSITPVEILGLLEIAKAIVLSGFKINTELRRLEEGRIAKNA